MRIKIGILSFACMVPALAFAQESIELPARKNLPEVSLGAQPSAPMPKLPSPEGDTAEGQMGPVPVALRLLLVAC